MASEKPTKSNELDAELCQAALDEMLVTGNQEYTWSTEATDENDSVLKLARVLGQAGSKLGANVLPSKLHYFHLEPMTAHFMQGVAAPVIVAHIGKEGVVSCQLLEPMAGARNPPEPTFSVATILSKNTYHVFNRTMSALVVVNSGMASHVVVVQLHKLGKSRKAAGTDMRAKIEASADAMQEVRALAKLYSVAEDQMLTRVVWWCQGRTTDLVTTIKQLHRANPADYFGLANARITKDTDVKAYLTNVYQVLASAVLSDKRLSDHQKALKDAYTKFIKNKLKTQSAIVNGVWYASEWLQVILFCIVANAKKQQEEKVTLEKVKEWLGNKLGPMMAKVELLYKQEDPEETDVDPLIVTEEEEEEEDVPKKTPRKPKTPKKRQVEEEVVEMDLDDVSKRVRFEDEINKELEEAAMLCAPEIAEAERKQQEEAKRRQEEHDKLAEKLKADYGNAQVSDFGELAQKLSQTRAWNSCGEMDVFVPRLEVLSKEYLGPRVNKSSPDKVAFTDTCRKMLTELHNVENLEDKKGFVQTNADSCKATRLNGQDDVYVIKGDRFTRVSAFCVYKKDAASVAKGGNSLGTKCVRSELSCSIVYFGDLQALGALQKRFKDHPVFGPNTTSVIVRE